MIYFACFVILLVFCSFLSLIVERGEQLKVQEAFIDEQIGQLRAQNRERLSPYIRWLESLRSSLRELQE